PWQWHYGGSVNPHKTYDPAQKNLISQTLARGGAIAFMLSDEPRTTEDIQAVAGSAQWMRQNYPELLIYVNVFQNDIAFLNSVVETIQPDLLMFDWYPYQDNGSTDHNGWFDRVMKIRQVSQAHDIPYGGWLQSYTYP